MWTSSTARAPFFRLLQGVALLAVTAGPAAALDAPRALEPLRLGGGIVRIEILQGGFALPDTRLREWVGRASRIIVQFYGRLPVPEMRVRLHTASGVGVRTGNMVPGSSPLVNVWVGERVRPRELQRDWVLVHELAHSAIPDVPDRHHWLEEGLAVYVESMSRMQAGDLPAAFVWGELATRMPNGQPAPGDRGLDRTATWGRTFWGGAMFCFVADLRIRRATGNRLGLRDALRGILAAGLDGRQRSSVREVLAAGDAATGTDVLESLYDQMRETPVTMDLDTAFARLGISVTDRRASFDDTAPEADLRRAMSSP